MATKYLVGTSGWHYWGWKGVFYPEKLPRERWLEFYGQRFLTVELNYSFYHLPKESSFMMWKVTSPPGFLIAVKASRIITHIKRLKDTNAEVERFFSRASTLGEKLGPVLYQLSPSLKRDEALLEAFLASLPKGHQHVVEFRNSSWHEDSVYDLLKRYKVAFCVHDMKGSASPVVVTSDFGYLRFHGSDGYYQGSYGDQQLAEWADKIRDMGRLKGVYIYFNNDVGGYAVANATTLQKLLTKG